MKMKTEKKPENENSWNDWVFLFLSLSLSISHSIFWIGIFWPDSIAKCSSRADYD